MFFLIVDEKHPAHLLGFLLVCDDALNGEPNCILLHESNVSKLFFILKYSRTRL